MWQMARTNTGYQGLSIVQTVAAECLTEAQKHKREKMGNAMIQTVVFHARHMETNIKSVHSILLRHRHWISLLMILSAELPDLF